MSSLERNKMMGSDNSGAIPETEYLFAGGEGRPSAVIYARTLEEANEKYRVSTSSIEIENAASDETAAE